MDEFALIRRYFSQLGPRQPEVLEGVGDDCAALGLAPGEHLLLSIDTSVADRHFPAHADPWAIGWRCLAIALSDLAAVAARPVGFTLAITLPEADEAWLDAFSQGLGAMAAQAGCSLIGGDTTLGPLTLSVQVHGAATQHHQWRRRGALAGDLIAATGPMGLAAAGLQSLLAQPDRAVNRADWNELERLYMLPRPHLAEALRLVSGTNIHAAIDVSDGLLADLQHLLAASALGAVLDPQGWPLNETLVDALGEEKAREAVMQGGDDYVLLITFAEDDWPTVRQLCPEAWLVGQCVSGAGMRTPDGRVLQPRGFNHFARSGT